VVIVTDHYESIGIVCLSVIRGVQRVARKQSISFIFEAKTASVRHMVKFGEYWA